MHIKIYIYIYTKTKRKTKKYMFSNQQIYLYQLTGVIDLLSLGNTCACSNNGESL